MQIKRGIPPSQDYAYEQTWRDGNGHSHHQATLLGPSLRVRCANSGPVLGTGSRSFTLNATFGPVNGPRSSQCSANDAQPLFAPAASRSEAAMLELDLSASGHGLPSDFYQVTATA